MRASKEEKNWNHSTFIEFLLGFYKWWRHSLWNEKAKRRGSSNLVRKVIFWSKQSPVSVSIIIFERQKRLENQIWTINEFFLLFRPKALKMNWWPASVSFVDNNICVWSVHQHGLGTPRMSFHTAKDIDVIK